MKFQGRNNSKHEQGLVNFAPTVCFTNTVLQTHTLQKHVQAPHWWRIPVASIVLHGTANMEYSQLNITNAECYHGNPTTKVPEITEHLEQVLAFNTGTLKMH